MGRGLSPLQRSVLRRALANRQAGVVGGLPDVLTAEVLSEHLGRPLRPDFYLDYGDGPRRYPRCVGQQQFSRSAIGPARYDAAVAATSRSLNRLVARGLAVRVRSAESRWSGIRLTDAGIEAARRLPPVDDGGPDDDW